MPFLLYELTCHLHPTRVFLVHWSHHIQSPYHLQCCIVWNMQWNQKHHTVPQAMVPTAITTFLIWVCSSVVPMKGGKLWFCSPRSQGRQPMAGGPGYVVWNWVASVFGCMCSWSNFNVPKFLSPSTEDWHHPRTSVWWWQVLLWVLGKWQLYPRTIATMAIQSPATTAARSSDVHSKKILTVSFVNINYSNRRFSWMNSIPFL